MPRLPSGYSTVELQRRGAAGRNRTLITCLQGTLRTLRQRRGTLDRTRTCIWRLRTPLPIQLDYEGMGWP